MRALAIVVAACALSCGHPAPPPAAPAPPPAPTLADEVDALCACTSGACRTDVHARFASVEQAVDVAPHALALRAYMKRCDAEAEAVDDRNEMRVMLSALCACHDAACAYAVQNRYGDVMDRTGDQFRRERDPKVEDEMRRVADGIAKCWSDAMAVGTTPSASAASGPAWDGTSTGVPACDAYLKAFDRYLSCDKIPQQAKDASAEGVAQMKQGWAMLRDPNVPREAKKAAADACKQAVDALQQSAQAMGCPL